MQKESKATERGKARAVMRFAEVALPPAAAGRLEVCLPDGTTLRGERVDELAALTRALRS